MRPQVTQGYWGSYHPHTHSVSHPGHSHSHPVSQAMYLPSITCQTLAYHKSEDWPITKSILWPHKNQTHLNDSLSFISWKDKRDLMSLYQASRNTQAVDNVSKVMPYSTNNGIITHPCVEVSMQHPYVVELSNCVHIMFIMWSLLWRWMQAMWL